MLDGRGLVVEFMKRERLGGQCFLTVLRATNRKSHIGYLMMRGGTVSPYTVQGMGKVTLQSDEKPSLMMFCGLRSCNNGSKMSTMKTSPHTMLLFTHIVHLMVQVKCPWSHCIIHCHHSPHSFSCILSILSSLPFIKWDTVC